MLNDIVYEEAQLIDKFAVEPQAEDCRTIFRRGCKNVNVGELLGRRLPIAVWSRSYDVRHNLLRDVLAGATVGIVHLPQGLAYALLASLPPIMGLYVSFFPVLVYMIFGTSRHISIGTFAVVSLMIAQVIEETDSTAQSFMSGYNSTSATILPKNFNITTPTAVNCEQAQDARKVQIAIALSLVNGIIQILMFLLRLGIVTTYLSTTLVSGFTCGAAVHVMTSQVPKLLGVDVSRHSGPFALIYAYVDVFKGITTINWAALIISIICIVFIAFGKWANVKLKKKLPVPIPWELAVVVFTTLISYLARLQQEYGVSTVGSIPTGIQTSVPLLSDVGSVSLEAVPIAIVAFATEISLSQIFATKHSYDVDPDQARIDGNGLVQRGWVLLPMLPVRTIIVKLSGLFSSAVILTILLWIGPLFESLPQAALASIIVVNLKNLLKQFEKIPRLWNVSRADAIVWVVTWCAVVFLGVSTGLGVAVLFQIFTVIIRIQRTNVSVLAEVGRTGVFRDVKRFNAGDSGTPEVVVLQYEAPLIYVNRDRFNRGVEAALGFDPKLAKEPCRNTGVELTNIGNTNLISGDGDKDPVPRRPTADSEDDGISLSQALTDNSNQQFRTCAVKVLVLDLSCCPFLDNDGVTTLMELYKALKQIDVRLILSSCNAKVYGAMKSSADADIPPVYVDLCKAVEMAHRYDSSSAGNAEDPV